MLRLNLYRNKMTTSKGYGMIYGRVEHDKKIVDIPALAKHIAGHGSIYTEDVILGVLNKMAFCLKELMLEGKKIKLSDIAIFSAEVVSTGAASFLAYDITKNVKTVRLGVRGTGDATRAELTKDAEIGYTSLAESLRNAERPQPDSGDDDDDNGNG